MDGNRIEYPEWNAEQWLSDKKKDKSFRQRAPKVKVFEHNNEIFKAGGYVSSSGEIIRFEAIPQAIVYKDAFDVNNTPIRGENTETGVINADCVDFTIELQDKGYNPALLNLSGTNRPCGLVKIGAVAQEESICRRTDLCQALYPYFKEDDARLVGADFIENVYPLNERFGAIYSPSIVVFRSTMDEGYALLDKPHHLSIISIGAINKKKASTPGLTETEISITKDRIRTIYRIGLINGHDSLVLGAFGCGAFKTPPEQVATLFKEVSVETEFYNKYKGLFFAILDKKGPKGKFAPFYDFFGTI